MWEPTDFGGLQVFEWPQSLKQLWTPDLTWIERYITHLLYFTNVLHINTEVTYKYKLPICSSTVFIIIIIIPLMSLQP